SLNAGDGAIVELAQPALDAARQAGSVSRFGFERRTLAEVFLDLVGRPADEDTSTPPDDVAAEPALTGERR
ncbi:MAG: hypothetical protein K0S92_849, partial [Desertimonas sp.]|nr:hypothetical protein [Desertimonas sp.]